jgi:glucose-1-phosphate adenylyltransferase
MDGTNGNDGSRVVQRTLAVVLTGGYDARLEARAPDTDLPGLPFGGEYTSVDFSLSNCINAGIRRIALVADQVSQAWFDDVQRAFCRASAGAFEAPAVEKMPAVVRGGRSTGTVAALSANLELIEQLAPDFVLLLTGADVHSVDYGELLAAHGAMGLGATVAAVEAPIETARGVGALAVGRGGRVMRYASRSPVRPPALPGDARTALVAIGAYVFDRELLVDCLTLDAADAGSTHDLGRDVLPMLVAAGQLAAHTCHEHGAGRSAYWRDVATLDRYWRANLELLGDGAGDVHWPSWRHARQRPPPRFVGSGVALRSIVSGGCSIAGRVEHSLLSHDCRVNEDAVVIDSVLLPGVEVRPGARICRAVVAAGCVVPEGFAIGEDAAKDAALYHVSAEGVVLVTAESLQRVAQPRDVTAA